MVPSSLANISDDDCLNLHRWVLAVLTPSAIVFLGDLIDEASEATPEEQARLSSSSSLLDPCQYYSFFFTAMLIASTEFTHRQKGPR